MKIESKLVKDLNPASYNPRQISSKQYKDLKESVKKFGLVDPIVVNKDMTIIMIAHRLSTLSKCNRILKLTNSKIEELEVKN